LTIPLDISFVSSTDLTVPPVSVTSSFRIDNANLTPLRVNQEGNNFFYDQTMTDVTITSSSNISSCKQVLDLKLAFKYAH
jgi:hypothetical protein